MLVGRSGRRHAGQAQERGGEALRGHGSIDDPAALEPRRGHDQRHLQAGPVEQQSVRSLAVLAEHLAVIAHRRDDPAPGISRQTGQQPPQLTVGERDLRPVPVLGRSVRGDRAVVEVGRVGIVVVHPEEVALPRREAGGPGQRRVGDGRRVALGIAVLADVLRGQPIVVDVEAAIEPETPIENPRGHEGGGRVPPPRKGARQGGKGLRQAPPGRCRAARDGVDRPRSSAWRGPAASGARR